jgi:DnaJ-class molecular chaperone
MTTIRIPAMTACGWCFGFGMRDYGDSVGDCSHCGGSGQERARDKQGRFLPGTDVEIDFDDVEATP